MDEIDETRVCKEKYDMAIDLISAKAYCNHKKMEKRLSIVNKYSFSSSKEIMSSVMICYLT